MWSSGEIRAVWLESNETYSLPLRGENDGRPHLTAPPPPGAPIRTVARKRTLVRPAVPLVASCCSCGGGGACGVAGWRAGCQVYRISGKGAVSFQLRAVREKVGEPFPALSGRAFRALRSGSGSIWGDFGCGGPG